MTVRTSILTLGVTVALIAPAAQAGILYGSASCSKAGAVKERPVVVSQGKRALLRILPVERSQPVRAKGCVTGSKKVGKTTTAKKPVVAKATASGWQPWLPLSIDLGPALTDQNPDDSWMNDYDPHALPAEDAAVELAQAETPADTSAVEASPSESSDGDVPAYVAPPVDWQDGPSYYYG